MSLSEMDAANRRDMADERRLREFQGWVTTFLADAPSRLSPKTRHALEVAVQGIQADRDHIVRVWD